ncbi:MAG: glutaredoxin family protein [Desulfomonilaceae bacterium]
MLCALGHAFALAEPRKSSKTFSDKPGTVWAVIFSSSDCANCEKARKLIENLRKKYPVRTKSFNIDRDKDRAIYKRLEAIHARDRFSVPVVLVGESVLVGEKEISGKLGEIVKKLAGSGGSQLPYLGPVKSDEAPATRSTDTDCDHCGRRGPPSVGEELQKVRGFLNKFF